MLEIKKLFHSFGAKCVLKEINLTVPDGCILGLVGINGAGKSTLLRLLAGVYRAEHGEILYNGRSPEWANTRKDIFFLPDDPYYTPRMTPRELFVFYKAFYPNIDEDCFRELLSGYGIDACDRMHNFSKGMRRQVFIALALAVKPKVLLLDEAFDGLDPLSRNIFKDAIISYVEQEGATVIIASHSLRELEDFCDRFALLDGSVIRSEGDISWHVGRLCKFQLAFTDEVTEELFEGLPIRSLNIRGKFVQIVLEGESESMLAALSELSPAVIDEMPFDFEEMFINDVSGKRGDTK